MCPPNTHMGLWCRPMRLYTPVDTPLLNDPAALNESDQHNDNSNDQQDMNK